MKLTIQSNNTLFEPPIKDGVKLEWERTGVPGKLTFTVLKTSELVFNEGDPVCFYYNDKPMFMGYVFKKKRDREHHIEVTCYDQLRYFKNKYTYVFENKTASQIVTALCDDFNLSTGVMDNTNYVIPAIAEENKSAFDITLSVLEDTLLNTGNMFVLYDDFGKLQLKNCTNMVSTTLIMEDTAENFDYTSSIDDETYNSIVLYYKNDDEIQQMYTASSPSTIKKWGTLRYFEEVKSPTIGQNKANSLLQLYNRKTRELKVTGAFGDATVRGGTLIPVKLNLGDIVTNNYMVVNQVTHIFENDSHTMDLTLDGAWEDSVTSNIISKTIGEITTSNDVNSEVNNEFNNEVDNEIIDEVIDPIETTDDTETKSDRASKQEYEVKVNCNGINSYAGTVYVSTFSSDPSKFVSGDEKNLTTVELKNFKKSKTFVVQRGYSIRVSAHAKDGHNVTVSGLSSCFKLTDKTSILGISGTETVLEYTGKIIKNSELTIKWVK